MYRQSETARNHIFKLSVISDKGVNCGNNVDEGIERDNYFDENINDEKNIYKYND